MVIDRFVTQTWGIAVAIPLVLIAAGCATQTTVTAREVETIIQESEAQDRARTIELDNLAVDCMIRNGFQYRGPTRESMEIDLAPGLDEEARIAAIGSGAVEFELWMLDQVADPFGVESEMDDGADPRDSRASAEDEAFWNTLHEEVTVDGETIVGGCVRWAEEEYIRQHPEYLTRRGLLEAYGSHMRGAYDDIRMSVVNDKWSTCMASEGFGEYHEIGDQHDDIRRRIDAVLGSHVDPNRVRAELEDLKRFDIAVSTAAYGCWTEVEAQRQGILAEYAGVFADIHQVELAELAESP